MTLNGNSDTTNGYNTKIANGSKTDANMVKAVLPPIGSVTAWLKSFANTPSLPDGWVECDGQTLSDTDSPYNGQTIPDLNGSSGEQRFLLGDTTSGTTGGVALSNLVHQHRWLKLITNANLDSAFDIFADDPGGTPSNTSLTTWDATNSDLQIGAGYASEWATESYTEETDVTPPHYTVVWIMRVK